MGKIDGVVVGIVTSVEDPQNLGRIQLRFPWLSDDNKSYWARVATLMTGPGHGSWFMPELDDEALVAFEHGDVQHPYVVGFLWSQKDKPPNAGIDSKVRRLKTVSDHILEFDDRPGKERILIQTKGEQQILLQDQPAKITIKTKGGQEITLDDTAAKITVQTSGGNKLEMSASGVSVTSAGGVTVNAAGNLSVTCLQASITASSIVSVTCPFVQFAGVVQATTFIATAAIVSPSYSPGAGNLL
jgi:uncharacterized protein involved in type VI secretion and phage assembly